METITRSEAVAQGLKKYYTGDACHRGHVSARYTQSGTCCQCVREHKTGTPGDAPHVEFPAEAIAAVAAQRELEQQRAVALRLLAEIKVWAYPEDSVDIKQTAAACCIGVFPCLTEADVLSKFGVTASEGGLGLYRVKVPAEYIPFMRQVAETYANKRSAFDVDAARTHSLGLTPEQIRFAMSNGKRVYTDAELAASKAMINTVLLSLGKATV